MGNFDIRVKRFIDVFINAGAYNKVLLGLKNTIIIAVLGLVIGILIGTLIATIRVLPKYRRLPRILNGFCSFYVSLFRGTPVVVQLLVFYYVLLPLLNIKMTSVAVSVCVFGLNSAAYVSEIMRHTVGRPRPNGGRQSRRYELRNHDDENYHSAGNKKYSAYARQRIHLSYKRDIGSKLCRRYRPLRCIQLYRQQQL